MKSSLVPVYRDRDLYTLFYDQDDQLIYKIPFAKKSSIISVYVTVIVIYIIGNLLNDFYIKHHSLFLDISLFIIGIAVAYLTVNIMYRVYYMEEKTRPLILNDSFLEECVGEGMKQSKREILVVIISFLFAVVTFIIFFTINSIKPLIFGCFSTSVFLSFTYMKPLKRRKVIKEWRMKKTLDGRN